MLLNTKERDALAGVLAGLEALAESQPQHSTTRMTIYRQAATLRVTLAKAVVTKAGRVDGHIC